MHGDDWVTKRDLGDLAHRLEQMIRDLEHQLENVKESLKSLRSEVFKDQ